jgi:predicted deacetylase
MLYYYNIMIVSKKNYLSQNTGLLVRLDDIAENMNWNLMDKCENLFDKHNIKPLLGVIPNNLDPKLLSYQKNLKFWDRVRSWKKKGWEISMHGYTHIYDSETNKKDYFNYGGKSEFYGHSYEKQKKRLKAGLKIFSKNKLKIRSFFAPNHTYDSNTFAALKENGIKNIIDGYGLFPYIENDITFIPQLFYKEIMLPYGVQSTQVHLNYWNQSFFDKFEKFIEKNSSKVFTFDQTLNSLKIGLHYKILNKVLELSLKTLRFLK